MWPEHANGVCWCVLFPACRAFLHPLPSGALLFWVRTEGYSSVALIKHVLIAEVAAAGKRVRRRRWGKRWRRDGVIQNKKRGSENVSTPARWPKFPIPVVRRLTVPSRCVRLTMRGLKSDGCLSSWTGWRLIPISLFHFWPFPPTDISVRFCRRWSLISQTDPRGMIALRGDMRGCRSNVLFAIAAIKCSPWGRRSPVPYFIHKTRCKIKGTIQQVIDQPAHVDGY